MESGEILLNGAIWIPRVERAVSLPQRLRGALGRDGLGGAGAALLIERCGVVHTLGMRFALDLIFLDRGWRVTRVARDARPGRLLIWGGWRATRVLEAEVGSLTLDNIHPGTRLQWRRRK